MDAAQGAVTEITPPRTSSFVTMPGERVFDSPTVTMHIQRSVLVPADHGVLWRTHKKLALGELTSRIDPQLPHLPIASGSITLQATIDKDGRVSNLRPLYGSSDLLPSVSKAIREWRYDPTYLDNKPVETQAQIELDFHPPPRR
jgi:outer membrane biosynthesis protein TonB